MKSLFTDADKIIMVCSVLTRSFGLLGAAGCFTEGHPYLSTIFLTIAGAAMELKDQVAKKSQNQPPPHDPNP